MPGARNFSPEIKRRNRFTLAAFMAIACLLAAAPLAVRLLTRPIPALSDSARGLFPDEAGAAPGLTLYGAADSDLTAAVGAMLDTYSAAVQTVFPEAARPVEIALLDDAVQARQVWIQVFRPRRPRSGRSRRGALDLRALRRFRRGLARSRRAGGGGGALPRPRAARAETRRAPATRSRAVRAPDRRDDGRRAHARPCRAGAARLRDAARLGGGADGESVARFLRRRTGSAGDRDDATHRGRVRRQPAPP